MDTLTAIQERRSIKKYDPAFEMPEADFERLFDLVLLSPTSFNIQNWRFVVVRDPEQKKKLCEAAWNQQQVVDSCFAVLLCGDLKAWEKDPQRYWRNVPDAAQEQLVPMIKNFYEGRGEQTQRDEVMRSCGIAAQTLMLAAKAMGYDTCPMIGFDAQRVAELIALPEDHVVGMMVVVGKSIADPYPRGGQLAKSEVVLTDRFPA
ncbi:putative NAD(P)H nitroreductase MhqN [Pseudobythopirellula maris]|uniref:Putative NAD(P)H nitroreductase MhqN n=1 Tax=Pseudobythopirellula maris TaxID=2527991 RepID=A0A5C5ZHZ0_9BACT|nr:nitroreductase family protein [Pseudobythopirellula maris]TWT86750.1 putative NAD(P)H nitroreductase MhqN [Pseudobythopirellula maris]